MAFSVLLGAARCCSVLLGAATSLRQKKAQVSSACMNPEPKIVVLLFNGDVGVIYVVAGEAIVM